MTLDDPNLPRVLAIARDILRRSGSLAPVLLLETPDASLAVGLPPLPDSHFGRLAIFSGVGAELAALRPSRAVAILDALMKRGSPPVPGRSLADDPDARDCIMVAALDSAGHSRLLVQPYSHTPRLDGDTFQFAPVEDFGPDGKLAPSDLFFAGVGSATA